MSMRQSQYVVAGVTLGILLQAAPVLAQSYGQSYGGGGNYNTAPSGYSGGPGPGANSAFAPAGLVLNATLATSISTEAARPGDLVEATLAQPVMLGSGQIPAGSALEGRVAAANAGGFLTRSGRLSVKFDRLRMPNGEQVPLAAHILGDLGKYKPIANGSDTFAGEGAGTKAGQALARTAIGAGAGAALGTAIGAIAGHGMNRVVYKPMYGPFGHQMQPYGYYPQVQRGGGVGAGRGAWSGAAIGGGVGLADAMLLRKGKNVTIQSGTPFQVQLDAPVSLAHTPQYGNI